MTLNQTFFKFASCLTTEMAHIGHTRISETYACALNSFRRFRQGNDLSFADIDARLMAEYEAYLLRNGLCRNTSSFYMRNLRAIYNRAVEYDLTAQNFPFRHVYTGIDRTVKRALSLSAIKTLKELDLKEQPSLDFARDMFLFSFYTRGMSFVDMAYLRKKDLRGRTLVYSRKKTGRIMTVGWEKCMQQIVDKYASKAGKASHYLLPIIKPEGDDRRQYCNASHLINKKLKAIGRMMRLDAPLTMYVARHCWASIAHSKEISLAVISECMGHESESTTRIYLADLDTETIDKANSRILSLL